MKEAIHKAIKIGGYRPEKFRTRQFLRTNSKRSSLNQYMQTTSATMSYAEVWSDPLFWQALFPGKSCFHNGEAYRHPAKCEVGQYEWEYQWHSFVTHLASGKQADEFFNDLLK